MSKSVFYALFVLTALGPVIIGPTVYLNFMPLSLAVAVIIVGLASMVAAVVMHRKGYPSDMVNAALLIGVAAVFLLGSYDIGWHLFHHQGDDLRSLFMLVNIGLIGYGIRRHYFGFCS